MQTVDAEVDDCALSCLDDFLFNLLAHLGYNFLDACREDTSVGNQLVKCQTGICAAHRILA